MDGQMTLDSFIDGCSVTKIKPLIYSQSLTCYKTICPYCRCDNPEPDRPPRNICRFCGKKFDDVNMEIRKSKDLMEVERLGLSGAVHKDEKGKWHEWRDPYERGNRDANNQNVQHRHE